ncbi:hypothetical protein B0H10DRAFT_1969993 [Mycena sp. CBHHK59/15]|nr:hypothetical protein B0H10DRAFT_1969993 [Mycena sp. CBHHK59/15]
MQCCTHGLHPLHVVGQKYSPEHVSKVIWHFGTGAYADPEVYRTARSFGWLWRIGSVFATKNRDRLGWIGNINEDHWVALAIDSRNEVIGYGDGFQGEVPPHLRKHLNWWIF